MSDQQTIPMRWLPYPEHTPVIGIVYSVYGTVNGEGVTAKGIYAKNSQQSGGSFLDTKEGLTDSVITHFGWPKDSVPQVKWTWHKDKFIGRVSLYRIGYIYENTVNNRFEAMYSLSEKFDARYGTKSFDTAEEAKQYIEDKFAQFYLDISLLTKK